MSPRYLWMLLVLAVVLITLLQVAGSQEDPAERRRRRQQRRRNQLARRRNRNRNRNNRRGRNRLTTTTTTTTTLPPTSTIVSETATGADEHHEDCEEIYLPMCKGFLPYTHTKLPNQFNHTTQAQVYQELEHKWAYMDHSCSMNTRQLICSTYLPKCVGSTRPAEGPCRRTCMLVRRRCSAPFRETFGLQWGNHFACRTLRRNRCVGAKPEVRCNREYPSCVNIRSIPACANLNFTQGTLPNLYQQCHASEIRQELAYYHELRQSNCHPNLDFLLCGVHIPFCIGGQTPLVMPCKEVCDQVKEACLSTYRRLYHDLPWPNKLQCHRFPATTTVNSYQCVMPNDETIYGGRSSRRS